MTSKPKIKLTESESGDWSILTAGRFERSNHSIGKSEFLDLLLYLGYDIDYQIISDEEMERLS